MLIMPVLILYKMEQLDKKLERSKVIVYNVDNRGGLMDSVGKVTGKQIIEGHYTITIGAYGKFLVTKEQYDSIKVGDDAPEYLKKRGS
nr:DUF1372 family protein [Streptococcus himalayensis]